MDAIFIYLLKANLLIAMFYLAYYFLVQKETFFNSNRWFLLSGLFTSVLIPLFFIKKIVIIETPKLVANNLSSISTSINPVIAESINWYTILVAVYVIISIILILKIASELVSFFKLIKNKKITVNKPFAMVDVDENISPFSFFKYIVFNSTKYSNSELENILNHEKVHSKEKHSLDVLIAKVICTLFWFNPFVWLYKKAVIQNLEYIADQKAIQNIEDKKAYQMTLLKVVTDHNCLSITNSFYQSLIKKRIVMLNKNQSQKRNLWKYTLILPVLIAFVMLFQIKVIAQEKITHHKDKSSGTKQVSEMTWTKDTPDDEIKNDVKSMKKMDIEVNYSDIKRNSQGEITAIKIEYKDKSGKTGNLLYSGDTPIRPIVLRKEIDANNNTKISLGKLSELSQLVNLNQEFPVPPTPPTPPVAPRMGKLPEPPTAPDFPSPPNIPAPTDPNDKKAWKKYEEKMQKFEESWNTEEMKKYEISMKAYEKEIEAYQPDMTAFEKEMEEFEAKMEKYQEAIEVYQEKIQESSRKK
ncbi:M56 family metallopeptidase [Flavobacterium sp.]|uniref:M56 family metallopeptidase n=1 Tax=Flavobacterium sp. TaxID=239 RepID=UPI00374DF312